MVLGTKFLSFVTIPITYLPLFATIGGYFAAVRHYSYNLLFGFSRRPNLSSFQSSTRLGALSLIDYTFDLVLNQVLFSPLIVHRFIIDVHPITIPVFALIRKNLGVYIDCVAGHFAHAFNIVLSWDPAGEAHSMCMCDGQISKALGLLGLPLSHLPPCFHEYSQTLRSKWSWKGPEGLGSTQVESHV